MLRWYKGLDDITKIMFIKVPMLLTILVVLSLAILGYIAAMNVPTTIQDLGSIILFSDIQLVGDVP